MKIDIYARLLKPISVSACDDGYVFQSEKSNHIYDAYDTLVPAAL